MEGKTFLQITKHLSVAIVLFDLPFERREGTKVVEIIDMNNFQATIIAVSERGGAVGKSLLPTLMR